jgi:hypothetical protein
VCHSSLIVSCLRVFQIASVVDVVTGLASCFWASPGLANTGPLWYIDGDVLTVVTSVPPFCEADMATGDGFVGDIFVVAARTLVACIAKELMFR